MKRGAAQKAAVTERGPLQAAGGRRPLQGAGGRYRRPLPEQCPEAGRLNTLFAFCPLCTAVNYTLQKKLGQL